MLFLANENFPKSSIELIRKAGYTIISIKEDTPGISDLSVFTKAKELKAIILTFDKDYGEIIYRNEIAEPASVVFFRNKGYDPKFAARF